MNTYLCIVCGFVYDESAGRPEDGIPAGTLWSAVAEDWACPECGVAKSDFEMVVLERRLIESALLEVRDREVNRQEGQG